MNRITAIGFAALEALVALLVPFAIPLVAGTLIWGFHYELGIDWGLIWVVSALIWLLGHAVPITATIDPNLLSQLELTAANPQVTFSLPLLGFAILTVWLGVHAGRRLSHGFSPKTTAGLSILFFLSFNLLLVSSVPATIATVPFFWAVMLPTLCYGIPVVWFILSSIPEQLHQISDWIIDKLWLDALPVQIGVSIRRGAYAAVIALVGLAGISAIILAVLLLTNTLTVVSLYESLQAGYLGGSIITALQLLMLPNLVIWTMSWFTGSGFSIGIGSQVSPLATELGPVPALPVFGAIPNISGSYGFVAWAIPIAAGFLAGLLLRLRADDGKEPLLWSGVTAVVAGVTSGLIAAALAWLASGALGPGRMAEVGVSALWFGLSLGILTLIGVLAGLLVKYFARLNSGV